MRKRSYRETRREAKATHELPELREHGGSLGVAELANRPDGQAGPTTIIRVRKRERDFTMIQNGTLRDRSLSFKATGVLVYLLSQPQDWTVRVAQLAGSHRDRVASVRSALLELSG